MPQALADKLVIAISSRALFDLEESNRVFEEEGLERYAEYQIAHEDIPLAPGTAFPLIRRLLALKDPETGQGAVEVILVSKNDANTGLRVFNSIEHHKINITRAAFTCGRSPYTYLSAFKADLFLSANPEDVSLALQHGYASATLLTGPEYPDDDTDEIRIAFDGDAVLFSDEAERVFKSKGLEDFTRHEVEKQEIPLSPGPFKGFLEALNRLQTAYRARNMRPIRTALVTARQAPSHKRAIKTLRHWGVTVDEAFFLGGLNKEPILEKFRPHIFFDDQQTYCLPASRYVPTGHVPAGIANEKG
ncbi:MAG TPA: 5'-nucleotidase [Bacillota bacterium]|nr:5'-nucleotidase [Bacillota bacterium]HPZ89732.1 5'-nucleotidase [Bacillota bacterium]